MNTLPSKPTKGRKRLVYNGNLTKFIITTSYPGRLLMLPVKVLLYQGRHKRHPLNPKPLSPLRKLIEKYNYRSDNRSSRGYNVCNA
jgi:hypothetical protein